MRQVNTGNTVRVVLEEETVRGKVVRMLRMVKITS